MKLAWLVVVSLACRKPAPAPEPTAPSMEDATAFANRFVKHMSPCDRVAVTNDIDIDLVARRSLPDSSERELAEFKAGATKSFVDSLCQAMDPVDGHTPSYTLLRVRTVNGQPHPVLRMMSGEQHSVTYHELTLDKRTDGVRIVDVLMYTTGETLTEMMGGMLSAMTDLDDGKLLVEAKRQLAMGNPVRARASIKRLPERMRRTKTVMMFDVMAAGAEGEDEFLKAADAFTARFPGDPSLSIIGIDQAFMRKDYKQALVQLDALDNWVGGDPMLDAQRAIAYLELGDTAQALAAATRGTKSVPEHPHMWFTLAMAQVAANQFKPAIATLDHIAATFNVPIDEAALREEARFVPLLESAEFKAR